MASEWHNEYFEENWAKKKSNAQRRRGRQNEFIVEDEDGSAHKRPTKKRNVSGKWILELTRGELLTIPPAGVLYKIKVRALFARPF